MDDIAEEIRAELREPRPGVWAVARRSTGDVIGYCGLFYRSGPLGEPVVAYELLRAAHGFGYATEAGRAVVD